MELKHAWPVDLGLVFIYSLFQTGCFFITVLYSSIGGWGTASALVLLASALVAYAIYDFRRTLLVFFSSSLVGSILIYFTSDAFIFFSSMYNFRITEQETWIFRPAHLITVLLLGFFTLSVFGGVAGDAIAERAGKGEILFTLRCAGCGTKNEQHALKCSFCGKELTQERYATQEQEKERLQQK